MTFFGSSRVPWTGPSAGDGDLDGAIGGDDGRHIDLAAMLHMAGQAQHERDEVGLGRQVGPARVHGKGGQDHHAIAEPALDQGRAVLVEPGHRPGVHFIGTSLWRGGRRAGSVDDGSFRRRRHLEPKAPVDLHGLEMLLGRIRIVEDGHDGMAEVADDQRLESRGRAGVAHRAFEIDGRKPFALRSGHGEEMHVVIFRFDTIAGEDQQAAALVDEAAQDLVLRQTEVAAVGQGHHAHIAQGLACQGPWGTTVTSRAR